MELTKDYIEKTNQAFEALKKMIEAGDKKTAEGRERIDKVQTELDVLEKVNQVAVKEAAKKKNDLLEETKRLEGLSVEDVEKERVKAQSEAERARELGVKERLDALELRAAENPGGGGSKSKYKETERYKAFEEHFKTGSTAKTFALPDDVKKNLMRTDSNIEGGFLIPTELDTMLRKEIVEVSQVRSIARVRTMSTKALEIVIRNKNLVARYEGEAEETEESTSKYRNETITPFRQSVTVPFTQDLMMDAQFNVEAEISEDVAIAFAKGEGVNHVMGDGVKKPEGFLQNPAIIAGARAGIAGVAGRLYADDIIRLTGDLKEGYSPTYVFNRRTLAEIRTLKGTGPDGGTQSFGDGQYLWQPALNGQSMATLAGDPYLVAEDMPDVSPNSLAIAYGDFMRGYEIFDRTGTMMIRDVYSKAAQGIVELTFMRWNTGRVILPEAITALKIASA